MSTTTANTLSSRIGSALQQGYISDLTHEIHDLDRQVRAARRVGKLALADALNESRASAIARRRRAVRELADDPGVIETTADRIVDRDQAMRNYAQAIAARRHAMLIRAAIYGTLGLELRARSTWRQMFYRLKCAVCIMLDRFRTRRSDMILLARWGSPEHRLGVGRGLFRGWYFTDEHDPICP